jgi:Tol biopolymer transport system component
MMTYRTGLAVLLLTSGVGAQVTERVSLGPGYQQSGGAEPPGFGRFVSADGRYVGFWGDATMAGSTTLGGVALLRDRSNGTTECVSVDSGGIPRVAGVYMGMSISSSGRYVVFYSQANDLVPGDTNNVADIFMRDRLNGTTERISIGSTGVEANGESVFPCVTNDGRFVVFTSAASNLVAGDTNAAWDIFLRDRQAGTTERVSISSASIQGNGMASAPTISADGRLVVFTSLASNLVSADTNGRWDSFVRDRQTGTTERVSVASDGTEGDGDSASAVISANGQFVALSSNATNLVPGDANGCGDIFVRDLQQDTTERVSVAPGTANADAYSGWPCISDDGRYVGFASAATNLIPGLTTPTGGVFVHDRLTGSTEIVSTLTGGALPNAFSHTPSISSCGRFVAFRSEATDLVPGDTNGHGDIFIHDRFATGFTSLCDPGQNNVIPCPCGNPPVYPTRGCDNSSFTGGATLSATGYAYISIDSLVFTTHSEKPSATSILLQGTAYLPSGVVFGQGVRCAGGTLKRLYVKTAIGGSITAPDPNSPDPTVSARSAALGVPIQPGQPYYYLVYYRDSTVLGGCPAASTFNATQTCSIGWWP